MENSKATEQEKVGLLFIYESDGKEWAKYMMSILKKKPYEIQCHSTFCRDLTKELTQTCSVLVLILSPEMETRASSLDLDLLQPDSTHSCLVECNGQVSETNMAKWRVVYTLEETVESQRAVLAGLIDLYEEVTGNKENINLDADDVLILDVIPVVLYPGQSEVYVIFNYQEKAEVTVSVEGVADRLTTRPCMKTVHVFNMPNSCTGQIYVNVFVGDQEDPIFSTHILIITPENLAQSLTLNLRRVLFFSDSEEQRATNEGFYVDPFSKTHCTNDMLKKWGLNLKKLLKADGGAEKTEDKPGIVLRGEAKDTPEVNRPDVTEPKGAAQRGLLKVSSKLNIFKNLFQKMFGGGYQANGENKKSRRIYMAKSQRIKTFPKLPRKQ